MTTGGTITINADRSTHQVAPDSVRFSVDLSAATFDTTATTGGDYTSVGYDRRDHALTYMWDFGDSDGTEANDLFPLLDDAPEHWKRRNMATGPWVSHMFANAGTFTVTLTVIEQSSGKSSKATTSIVVADPDVYYNGTGKTVWINNVGDTDFSDAEAEDANNTHMNMDDIYTTAGKTAFWAATETISGGTGSSDNKPVRILLRNGSTFAMGCEFSTYHADGIYFGGYGSGAKPVLTYLTPNGAHPDVMVMVKRFYNNGSLSANDFRMTGMAFQDTYDVTAAVPLFPTPVSGRAEVALNMEDHGSGIDMIVHDCTFDGFEITCVGMGGQLVAGTGSASAIMHYHFNSCATTNFGGQYPWYAGQIWDTGATSMKSFTGCTWVHETQAILNTDSGGGTQRAPMRLQSTPITYMRGCDFFFQNGSQPCFKMNEYPVDTANARVDGHKTNITMNKFEGAGVADTSLSNYSGAWASTGRSGGSSQVWDSNLFLTTNNGPSSFTGARSTGVTVRNNLLQSLDRNTNPLTTRTDYGFIGSASPGAVASATVLDAPIDIHHNTLYMERSTANNEAFLNTADPAMTNISDFTNVTEEDNILHLPNVNVPKIASAPLGSTLLATSRTLGMRAEGTGATFAWTTAHSIKSNALTLEPEVGSAALNATAGANVPVLDLNGHRRASTPNKGAIG